jgi:hypothetical protein
MFCIYRFVLLFNFGEMLNNIYPFVLQFQNHFGYYSCGHLMVIANEDISSKVGTVDTYTGTPGLSLANKNTFLFILWTLEYRRKSLKVFLSPSLCFSNVHSKYLLCSKSFLHVHLIIFLYKCCFLYCKLNTSLPLPSLSVWILLC